MEQVIKLLLLFVCILVTAWIDFEHIDKEEYINEHRSRWIQRFIIVLLCGGLDLFDTIGEGLVFMSSFDIVLNKIRGKKTFYFGSVSRWDQFWYNKTWLYKIIMPLLFIAGCILIIC